MMWRAPIGPECDSGKHDACNGDAWNFETDEPAGCECICHYPGTVAHDAHKANQALAEIGRPIISALERLVEWISARLSR